MPTSFANIRQMSTVLRRYWNRGSPRDRRARITSGVMMAFRVLQMVLGILLMRMMISELGVDSYGIWVLITGIAAFSASADLGIGNSVMNFIAYAFGANDWREMGKIILHSGFALAIITVLLVSVGAVIVITTGFPEQFFADQSSEQQVRLSTATICFAASIVLSIPLSVFEKFLSGIQQGGTALLWRGGGIIVSTIILIILTISGADVTTLIIVHATVPLLALGSMSYYVHQRYKSKLYPGKFTYDKNLTSKLIRDSSWFCLLQLAVGLGVMSDNYVVGYALGSAAVTTLAVPGKLFVIAGIVIGALTGPLWPAYAEAVASKDIDWITKSLRKMTQYIIIIMLAYGVGVMILGDWACRMLSAGETGASMFLLMLLVINSLQVSLVNLMAFYLNARRLMKIQLLFGLTARLLNVLLSLYLVQFIGVEGAILATILIEIPLLALPFAWIIRKDLLRIQAQPNS